MRIYVIIPEKFNPAVNQIRIELHKELARYYGRFLISDIEFFPSNDESVTVYIMEKSKRQRYDTKIISAITEIFGCPVVVKLNYQQLYPNFRPSVTKSPKSSEFDYEKLSRNYHAEKPLYNFSQVILPKKTRDAIEEAVAVIQVEDKVFDKWGLRSIIPFAASAISFYGSPGTGKTMAAEAVASMLGKKIIRATYADIESKYHGEGPKMVKAIFLAAEREDAVLFIDESDSLLSKRLTNVSSGSEQAINSMRSQLLTCLERFRGIVIFATNLIVNYDEAFLSRLISIEIPSPDFTSRLAIWKRHLFGDGLRIPLSDDINLDELAKKYDTFCGREIKNAVLYACVKTAKNNCEKVTQNNLLEACEKAQERQKELLNASDYTKNRNEVLKDLMQKKINEQTK